MAKQIIVIQCAKSKNPSVGYWRHNNQEVKFVADPSQCDKMALIIYAKPDDTIPGTNETWRQKLQEYNRVYDKTGSKPSYLCKAWELYKRAIYKELKNEYGEENVFILSAGWGLVRSDYLLPNYDITFSDKTDKCAKRGKHGFGTFKDENQLAGVVAEQTKVYFFGTPEYFPIYCYFTQNTLGEKIIYYCGKNVPKEDNGCVSGSYRLIKYKEKGFYNWHYSCAKDFIEGKVPKCTSTRAL